ncbi:aminodeoxychorismate synthase component I [Cryobacterium sp. Hh11]|uniref:aminodeoxychorismate synthase component I n=1 Tax=Cryobacterium sp. Hh11 TaxID=2555868 RepID=UPI00106AC2F1|nr:aminodeoxychorismate synthase component I [Cryobacterium sp. Hh11]TFD54806.1 aminodeoxychorismate synthase component I [Cryobacterium sp. Hh11]
MTGLQERLLQPADAVTCREIVLDFWVDPELVFLRLLKSEKNAFWLDSGFEAETGVSYLGLPSPSAPVVTASGAGDTVLVSGVGTSDRFEGSIFDLLRLTTTRRGAGPVADPVADPADGLRIGWVGWLGYELGAKTVGSPRHASALPDAALMWADRIIAFDHRASTMSLRVPAGSPTAKLWVRDVQATLRSLVGNTVPPLPEAGQPRKASLRHTHAEYVDLVEQCRDAIAEGDAYQICLTNEITIEGALDPVQTYRRLRRLNPAHHGALIRFADFALLSSSPEQFLEVCPDKTMTTRPIKGTRPRGRTSEEDAGLITELAGHHKEIAENVMIVDLMRNDLGRVAETGSVQVPDLLRVESYQNVHQLVSTISARIDPRLTWVDAVEACLPAGSMTGAPKHSAMSIIDRLERGARGPYAGAFGYMGADGRVDLGVTIRSLVIGPTTTTIGAGGGITAWSVAEEEYEETLLKAAPLLAAASAVITA